MLTPDVAKQRLEQWRLTKEDDYGAGENLLAQRAATLPKSLRTVAYGLLNRDAEGNEPDWEVGQTQRGRAVTTCEELDAWPPTQRLRLFELFLPTLAEQIELTWQFLKATPYPHGYARKAFRAPNHAPSTFPKRIAW